MPPDQITSIRANCVLFALGLTTAAMAAAAPSVETGNAAVIAAESALAHGDCRPAIASYQEALQQLADVELAERATQAALDCGQFQTAETFAIRWRQLAPDQARAALSIVRARLGRYELEAARSAFDDWLKGSPPPDVAALRGAIDFIESGAGQGASFALLRRVQHPLLRNATIQARLAMLAYGAGNYQRALDYAATAKRGNALDANEGAALQAIVARAAAGLGRAELALQAADAAAGNAALADTRAEVLQLLGREAAAREEWLRLRGQPATAERAERRLAELSFNSGDYVDAEQRFSALTRQRTSAAYAVYFLGMLAERAKDNDAALQRYELLAGSDLDEAARRRVAGIYFRDNERSQAVQMLSPRDNATIPERIAAANTISELFSLNGAHGDALARLDRALESFPGNTDIDYQRSVVQARGNMADAAVATLEGLYRSRPADPTVGNALGYTLADFNRELPRAEKLIGVALAAEPDNAAILDSMGWVLYRRGRAREALPYFERSWRLLRQGDIAAHWGEALWSLGRTDEARAIWQRAIAADPEDELLMNTARRFHVDLQPPKARKPLGSTPGTSV